MHARSCPCYIMVEREKSKARICEIYGNMASSSPPQILALTDNIKRDLQPCSGCLLKRKHTAIPSLPDLYITASSKPPETVDTGTCQRNISHAALPSCICTQITQRYVYSEVWKYTEEEEGRASTRLLSIKIYGDLQQEREGAHV